MKDVTGLPECDEDPVSAPVLPPAYKVIISITSVLRLEY